MDQVKAYLARAAECERAAQAASAEDRLALLVLAKRFRVLADHAQAGLGPPVGIEDEAAAAAPTDRVSNPRAPRPSSQ